MTKEIQAIQRQVLEKSVSLPRNSSYGQIAGAFSKLAELGTHAAAQISSEKAAQEGASLALEGKPKKLAPGLTQATKAYNNAYLNTQGTLASLNSAALMDAKMREMSAPGRLNSDSVGQFNEVAKGIIQGTLEGVNPEIKADVGLKLAQHLFANQGRMAEKVQAYNLEQLNTDFNFALNESYRNLNESILGGDEKGVRIARQEIEQLLSDRKALGMLDKVDEANILRKMNDTFVSGVTTREYLQSRISGTEEDFLARLANKKPEGMTFDQWNQAASQVLTLKRQQDGLVSEAENLRIAEWQQKIVSGEVTSLEGLDGAKDQMSALSFVKLQTSFMQAQAGESKKQANIDEFLALNLLNPVKASQKGDDVKNGAYNQLVDAARVKKQEELQNPDATLSMLEKSEVASHFNTPIPEFNAEMNYAFLTETADPAKAVEALQAYKRLVGDPASLQREKVLSLDKKAEQIAASALFQNERGGLSPELAVQRAKESVLKVNEVTKESRLNNYKTTYGGVNGEKNLTKQIKADLGIDPSINPEVKTTYENLLRINSQAMETLEEAREFTKRQLKNKVGSSKYGPDNETALFNPPEKVVPMIENGYWFDNQFTMAVNQVAKNWERKRELEANAGMNVARYNAIQKELKEIGKSASIGGQSEEQRAHVEELFDEQSKLIEDINVGRFKSSSDVRWGGAPIPDKLTEQDILSQPILGMSSRRLKASEASKPGSPIFGKTKPGEKKPTLIIGGEPREIFVLSDATTMSRENGRTTFGLYYKDQFGFTQPVPDPFNERGVAEYAVKPFEEFLPNTSRELSDKTINQVAEKEANALFERDNPKRIILDNFVPHLAFQREFMRRQFVEEKQPELAQHLKQARDKKKGATDGSQ